jgi:SAM-dependent methyltransferase
VPSFVRKNKINAKENLFVMLSPEMCNNAVSRSAELYNKIYLQEKFENKFKFITIPFGPDAERSLAIGGEMTYISDKDSLVELEVEKSPTFSEIWGLNEYNLLYDADDHLEDILNIFSKIKITKKSKILDSCVGPGFMTTELIERGYPIMSNDRNKENVKPFIKKLKTKGIFPRITHNEWLDLRKLYKKNSLDLIFNKGNTFIYADGGFQKDIPIDKNKSLESYRKTLKIYYDLLKKGGHLYIDKFKDSEIPAEKTAARLKISDSKEKKDLIFKVERKPEKGYRFASISLKDKENNLESHSFTAYDLTEDEMETLLKETGFEVKRLNLKSEKHFVVWLAKK